jgi:hypothetical protein
MIRHIGLWLVGCALFVTPVAADEDVYDGPTAIKPLTVTPQPQHSAPTNSVCDFEHQCYPEKGGPTAPAPVAPPAIVVKPIAPRAQVPDEPIVATWRDCMGRGLQNYEQSHDLHALQVARALRPFSVTTNLTQWFLRRWAGRSLSVREKQSKKRPSRAPQLGRLA